MAGTKITIIESLITLEIKQRFPLIQVRTFSIPILFSPDSKTALL